MRLICPLLAGLTFSAALAAAPVPVGVARIDITPELPIRLTGYTNRPTEADRAESRLHARALAIGGDAEGPAIVIVAEVLAVSERLTEAVVAGIRARHPVPRERIGRASCRERVCLYV